MRIIILMIYAALGYAVYVFVRGYFSNSEAERRGGGVPKGGGESSKMVECSQCGTMIPLSHSKSRPHSGETVYFCSDVCLEKGR